MLALNQHIWFSYCRIFYTLGGYIMSALLTYNKKRLNKSVLSLNQGRRRRLALMIVSLPGGDDGESRLWRQLHSTAVSTPNIHAHIWDKNHVQWGQTSSAFIHLSGSLSPDLRFMTKHNRTGGCPDRLSFRGDVDSFQPDGFWWLCRHQEVEIRHYNNYILVQNRVSKLLVRRAKIVKSKVPKKFFKTT